MILRPPGAFPRPSLSWPADTSIIPVEAQRCALYVTSRDRTVVLGPSLLLHEVAQYRVANSSHLLPVLRDLTAQRISDHPPSRSRSTPHVHIDLHDPERRVVPCEIQWRPRCAAQRLLTQCSHLSTNFDLDSLELLCRRRSIAPQVMQGLPCSLNAADRVFFALIASCTMVVSSICQS